MYLLYNHQLLMVIIYIYLYLEYKMLDINILDDEIPGLYIIYDVITKETENEIIKWLDTQKWSSSISRRTQHYGYEYNYYSKI